MRLIGHRVFPADPSSPRDGRRFVAELARDLEVDLDGLSVLTSELITNAVLHAGTPAAVTVFEGGGHLRVEVGDGAPDLPAPRSASLESPTGRGMQLVQALCSRSGAVPTATGKVVWFELPVAVSAEAPIDPRLPQPIYSIGAVARLVGVDVSTIRSWERRYGVVVPERTDGGQRVYSRNQVEQLGYIAAHIDAGLSAGDAHRLLAEIDGSTTSPPDSETTMLVLIADRDPYAAELFEYFLRTEGYEVKVALDVEDTRRSHAQRPANLVVLEALLDPRASLDLCRDLAASGVPVIVVSPLAIGERAIEAGASAFVSKPFEPLQFVSVVRDLLGTSALSRRPVRVS